VQIRFVDWTYGSAGGNATIPTLIVQGAGAGSFALPASVRLQTMYKTNATDATVMRLQVGSAHLADGTAFAVAEGTRENPLPAGGPDSSFLLSTRDGGASWDFRRAFDRQDGMPSSVHGTTSYPLGPSEPNVALLPDGRTMVLVARMKNGAHLWQATSPDQGRTWTAMAETAAWAVYPQLLTLGNGAVVLASGRPGIGLWVLDSETLRWGGFRNLAAAHNDGLPPAAPAEQRFPASYSAITSANDSSVDFHQPLSKAYLGLYELGCDDADAAGAADGGHACSVIVMYDKLGNGDKPPPGPAGEFDQVFTMEAVVTVTVGGRRGAEGRPDYEPRAYNK
jgi:hypothetical protein